MKLIDANVERFCTDEIIEMRSVKRWRFVFANERRSSKCCDVLFVKMYASCIGSKGATKRLAKEAPSGKENDTDEASVFDSQMMRPLRCDLCIGVRVLLLATALSLAGGRGEGCLRRCMRRSPDCVFARAMSTLMSQGSCVCLLQVERDDM